MKTINHSDSKHSYKEQKFTLNIGAIYFVLLALVLMFSPKFASAELNLAMLEEQKSDHLATLAAVGRGELTWFGFSVYEASLWTKNGKYMGLENSVPIALAITYQRSIDSEDLANRTSEEWERLGIFKNEQRQFWQKKLKQIWPDVKAGDTITTLVTSENITRFYYNDNLLAVLDDPAFGTALLSIWLDPNTSEPDLRKQLIGHRGE